VNYESTPSRPVSMAEFETIIKIKNIGEKTFPGGKLTQYKVEYPDAIQSIPLKLLPEIPPIRRDATYNLPPQNWHPKGGGLSWVVIGLKSNDEDVVELYQSIEGEAYSEWRMPLYITKGEHKEIIEYLQRITKQLEKLLQGIVKEEEE